MGWLCLATLGKGVCGGRIISFLTLIRQGSEQVSRLCRKSTDNIEDAFDNVANLVAFGMGASVKRCLFLRRANYIHFRGRNKRYMYCIVEYRMILCHRSYSAINDFIDRCMMKIDDSSSLQSIKESLIKDYGERCQGVELIRIEFATLTCPK